MFKELFSAFRSGDTLDRAFSQLLEMLDHAKWMFVRANDVLQNTELADEVKDSIYRRDQAINELERSIRRKILRHLTINPGHDVAACLALMSVAKDAERIGDYCKNVFEVGRFYREGFHIERFQRALDSVRDRATKLFSEVAQAFRESDEAKANLVIEQVGKIRRECDEVIEDLLSDEEAVRTHEAVAYSLLARHYKRVAAHLGNIATAVLGRIEDLDFEPH